MTPLPSYTAPQARDLSDRRRIAAIRLGLMAAALWIAALILARATLATLAALPNLTAPAMVPGCC